MATIIEMPKLSDTMTVGTLVTWLKQEGDKVSSGDKIAEIETDKATMEMEVFDDGVLLKQIAAIGEQVAVGDPICAIGQPGEKVDVPEKKPRPVEAETPAKKPAAESAKVPPPPPPAPSTPTPSTTAPSPVPSKGSIMLHSSDAESEAAAESDSGRLRVSPLARKLAAKSGVDLARVTGTGPGGRIVKADVIAAAAAPKPPVASIPAAGRAAPGGEAEAAPFVGTSPTFVQEAAAVQVSNMRATIARRLVESKTQIPHFNVEIEVDVAPLLALRTEVNEAFGESSKLSVNDFILKACAHALRRVPAVNCSWEAPATGSAQPTIKHHAAAHISFAVAIDDGLITPVIFDAHAKTIFQIAAESRALAAKAKARKLQPSEFTGGTFCVSNLGMFGVPRFSAIINPPNAAILAVGTTVKKPVVNEAGEIVVGQRMDLTLSCDHRVVDGAIGARFLVALKEILEKPILILG